MASLQSRMVKGKKYWYVVESKRINGKPRPIVIAYLGSADNVLSLLTGDTGLPQAIKTWSHGLIFTLYVEAQQLGIAQIINSYAESHRNYMAKKPVINGLTVGETILLAAFGRACHPTSKQGWNNWAVMTSLSYLLGKNLDKIDSQHFWDHMDCLSEEALAKIETDIVSTVCKHQQMEADTLLFDATNFFTYIDSANKRCTIAKRGANKQKRIDLRQVSYALVVTKRHHLPLFQYTYAGNKPDCILFREVLGKIKERLILLGLDFTKHTLIFDKGMPSKKNFEIIDQVECSYVTSLRPSHYKSVIQECKEQAQEILIGEERTIVARFEKTISGKIRTLVVYLSLSLRRGVMQGIQESIQKRLSQLTEVQKKMHGAKRGISRNRKRNEIEKIIGKSLKGIIEWRFIEQQKSFYHTNSEGIHALRKENVIESARVFSFPITICISIGHLPNQVFGLSKKRHKKNNIQKCARNILNLVSSISDIVDIQYEINLEALKKLEDGIGFKILATNRSAWSSLEIIEAYNGQAAVEEEFKNIKNPYHLAVRPQFHWTDQKIRVHFTICFIAHLLSRLIYKKAQEETGFRGTLTNLLENLSNIRLASCFTQAGKKKGIKTQYSLERLTSEQERLVSLFHIHPSTLPPLVS